MIHLQHKFYTFKVVDTRTMDENIYDFLKIISYLSSVNVTVLEEVHAIRILNSLPLRFNSLKETLKYDKDTLSLEEVTSETRSKYHDLKTSRASHYDGEGYYSRGRTKKKDHVRIDKEKCRSSSRSRITCWFCKKHGHTKRDFIAYKKYGREEEVEAAVVIDPESMVNALSVSDKWHHDK